MQQARVLGCRVDALGSSQALDRIVELAQGAEPSLVVTLATEMVVHAQRDERFRSVVETSALSLCDTIGVMYAARLQGVHLPGRVTGVDLIDPLCARFARAGLSVYFLGGRGDTSERAAANLKASYPELSIAGARDGYFPPAEDAAVAAAIAASGARVLFVGLGSPRQELWLAEHLEETGCSVGIGVGGSFDVLAGNVERAPALWRRLNAEWLYRLLKEPARWRRQLALPKFVWLTLRERVAGNRLGGH